MKKYYLFLMILLTIPYAFADIIVATDQSVYNFGNKIKASASILQDKNFDGFLKLSIVCGSYKLNYFLTPISLEPNFRTAASVPEVVATPSMHGNCTITADLTTDETNIIEEKQSNSFSVTNQLNVLAVKSKITSLPSDTIHVAGVVNEAAGNNVLKAAAHATLDGQSHPIEIIDGKFNITLDLAKNIKSGKHDITISASDSKNNIGEALMELEVTAVPTYLKIDLSGNIILPGSRINITSSLYDQADDLINESLDLGLTSPNGDKMFGKIVQSNEKIDYEFSQYAEPGVYALVSTYKGLLAQVLINIETVRHVNINYANESVVIENVGNVPYIDEVALYLKNEFKKYDITRNIKLEPGKILEIDLSKEVPSGIYDVVIPIKEGLEPIESRIGQILQNSIELSQENLSIILPNADGVLANSVSIHDNRPIYKKFSSGMSSVTGYLIGADGLLTKNPIMAPLLLVILVVFLVFRYGRKPIMKLLKRKKDDDNNEGEI